MTTDAHHVRRLLDRADTQATLNGIAFRLGLVTMEADADTVRRRLRAWCDEHPHAAGTR